MEAQESAARAPLKCHGGGCERDAIVFLGGRPLCAEHYLENVNEVNNLGLTPRTLSEEANDGKGAPPPPERLIRESAKGPERKPATGDDT